MTKVICTSDRIVGAMVGAVVGNAFGSGFTGLRPQEIREATGGTGVCRFLTKIFDGYKERLGEYVEGRADASAEIVMAAAESLIGANPAGVTSATDDSRPDSAMDAVLRSVPLTLHHALSGTDDQTAREDLKRLCLAAPDGLLAYLAANAIAAALTWPVITGAPIIGTMSCRSAIMSAADARMRTASADDTAAAERYDFLYSCFVKAIRGVERYHELREMTGERMAVHESVPFCLLAAIRNSTDFEYALIETVNAGGDTGKNAAVVGAIVGASIGIGGMPALWLAAVPEAGRAARLAEGLCGLAWREKRMPTDIPTTDDAVLEEQIVTA